MPPKAGNSSSRGSSSLAQPPVKRIYFPGDFGKPSSFDNEDLLMFETTKPKAFIKRTLHVRQPEYLRIADPKYMTMHGYNLMVSTLAENSFASGPGEKQGHIVTVFYDPVREEKTQK